MSVAPHILGSIHHDRDFWYTRQNNLQMPFSFFQKFDFPGC